MKLVKTKTSAVAAAVFVAQGFAQTASAQDALEEVIVTANKRQESLQDVGTAVSAFTAETLDRLGISDGREVLRIVPNVIVNEVSGDSFPNIYLRGIGTRSLDINFQSGVGVYSDEIVATPAISNVQTYDLERVEVLKGPQNTLYGRNTTGGAINYISIKPEVGGERNGYLDLTYGRFNQIDVRGAYGTPIGENSALRFAFISQDRDGIRENIITGRDGEERDRKAARLQFAWNPTENTSVLLKAHAERGRGGNWRYTVDGLVDPSEPLIDPTTVTVGVPFGTTVLPCSGRGCAASSSGFVAPRTSEFGSDQQEAIEEIDSSGFSANITVDFDKFTFTSITGYEEVETFASEDTDGTPEPWFHFQTRTDQFQVTQEFRLTSAEESGFRWIAGLYGHQEENTGGLAALFGPGVYFQTDNFISVTDTEVDTFIFSAYGELEFDLSDQFTLNIGLRYSEDNLDGTNRRVGGGGGFGPFPFPGLEQGINDAIFLGVPLPNFEQLFAVGSANGAGVQTAGLPGDPITPINDTKFDEVGGSIGLDWRVNDDIFAYAKFSRGFKSGNFTSSPRVLARGGGGTPILPETVNTYEIGLKTEFWDGRGRINTAIFFNDYEDQQLTSFEGGIFNIVSADSEIFGADIEGTLAPAEGWLITFGLGFLDTEVTDTEFATRIGNEIIGSPDFSGNFAISKVWDTAGGNSFGVGVDGRYVGAQNFDIGTEATGFQESDDAYSLFNAHAYYAFGSDQQHRVTAWVDNLNDELFKTTQFGGTVGFVLPDFSVLETSKQFVYSDPRTFGVTYRYEF